MQTLVIHDVVKGLKEGVVGGLFGGCSRIDGPNQNIVKHSWVRVQGNVGLVAFLDFGRVSIFLEVNFTSLIDFERGKFEGYGFRF